MPQTKAVALLAVLGAALAVIFPSVNVEVCNHQEVGLEEYASAGYLNVLLCSTHAHSIFRCEHKLLALVHIADEGSNWALSFTIDRTGTQLDRSLQLMTWN